MKSIDEMDTLHTPMDGDIPLTHLTHHSLQIPLILLIHRILQTHLILQIHPTTRSVTISNHAIFKIDLQIRHCNTNLLAKYSIIKNS